MELAKEYMRAKVSIDSPSSQNWQSHLIHKNKKVQTNSHYGAKMLDLKIPRSLAQLPAKIPESSYLTRRSLGRSGTYKMEGSLYAKVSAVTMMHYIMWLHINLQFVFYCENCPLTMSFSVKDRGSFERWLCWNLFRQWAGRGAGELLTLFCQLFRKFYIVLWSIQSLLTSNF